MSLASDCRRLKEVDLLDLQLLIQAVLALALASLAIRVLPFRKVVHKLVIPAKTRVHDRRREDVELCRVQWAVAAAARRLPWRIVCFQKGLAVQRLLARRGIPAALHYGVAQTPEQGLTAHVWVTHSGRSVVGGEEAERFVCLASYPPIA